MKLDTDDMSTLCRLNEKLKEERENINNYQDKNIILYWSEFRIVYKLVREELERHGVTL